MKKMLSLSAGCVHPPWTARLLLKSIIAGVPGIEAEWTSRVEDLRRLEGGGYDGLLLYLHRREISDGALEALDRFVSAGGGVVALHSATASFKSRAAYFDILGGRFTGHGRVTRFTARPAAADVFGCSDTFTLRDELYHHELIGEPEILYTASDGAGDHPAAWRHSYGRGRVFYLVTGHRAGAFRNPVVRRLLTRGTVWACGGEETS